MADRAFKNCNSLTNVKMDKFSTSKVKSLISMFEKCSSLTSLYLPNFYTNDIQNTGLNNIFEGCTNLKVSLYPNKCSNLITILPEYVKVINLLIL